MAQAQWSYSGQTGAYVNVLGVPSSTVTQGQKMGNQTDLKLDYKFDSPWKFKSDLSFRTDLIARDAQEFFQLMPKSFYLQRKWGAFQFKAGIQTFNTDGPDTINPADIVNPKNWVDPTSPVTFGSPALSLSQEIDEWNWEFFYVPKQSPPVLPGSHSPWLPRKNRLPIESEKTTVLIPDNVEYQYLGGKTLNDALLNNFAFKLQRKSEHFEAQLVYSNGLSQSPFLQTEISGSLVSVNPQIISVDSPVRLRPLYYRQQVLAATFVIPFESWAIKGGFNWLSPRGGSSELPQETSLYVIGLEKNMETSLGLVTGVAEYIRQKRQDANQISFLRSIFEEAASGGVRVPFGEETTFFAGGMYDLIGQSSLLKFSLQHRLNNSWSFETGAQRIEGPSDKLLGIYRNHDSYQFKLMFSW